MRSEDCGNGRTEATEAVEKSESTGLLKMSFWCFYEAEQARWAVVKYTNKQTKRRTD